MPHIDGSGAAEESTCPLPMDGKSLNSSEDIHGTSMLGKWSTRSGRELFDWSQELQGIILGAYFWGYGLAHIPGALLTQRYGGKMVLLFCVMVPALLSMFTPTAVVYGESHPPIIPI